MIWRLDPSKKMKVPKNLVGIFQVNLVQMSEENKDIKLEFIINERKIRIGSDWLQINFCDTKFRNFWFAHLLK